MALPQVMYTMGPTPDFDDVLASIAAQVAELEGDLEDAVLVAPEGATEKQVNKAIEFVLDEWAEGGEK